MWSKEKTYEDHVEKTNTDNVTSGNDLKKRLNVAMSKLINVLKKHCGPMGDYAVLTSDSVITEPTFTKDGINIIRSIKYDDPVDEFMRKSLEYIGSKIETSAGDGTTSSMLMYLHMMQNLSKSLESGLALELKNVGRKYSASEIRSAYNTVKDKILKEYDENIISAETLFKGIPKDENHKLSKITLNQIIEYIAYSQTYTSSHGDTELATAVSKLFSNMPKEAWDNLTIESSRYETDFRYKTEIDDAQYTLEECRAFPVTQVKDALGLECNRTNTKVIISNMAPSLAFVDTDYLLKKIEEYAESGEELTIICPDELKDAPTLQHINDIFEKNPNHKVVMFFVYCRDKLNDVVGAKVLGIPGADENGEHILSYKFKGSELSIIDGLYPKTDEVLYPYTDNDVYTSLVNHAKQVVEDLNTSKATVHTNRALHHVRKFLLKMTVVKRPSLLLGGHSYDNITSVDIAIDAITATKKSLTDGFVLGNNKDLYKTCMHIRKSYNEKQDNSKPIAKTKQYNMEMNILDSIMEGVSAIYEYTFYPDGYFLGGVDKTSSCKLGKDDSYTRSIDLLNPDNVVGVSSITPIRIEFLLDHILKHSEMPMIIQPKSTDTELVTRFGEVGLKFLSMDKIIHRV